MIFQQKKIWKAFFSLIFLVLLGAGAFFAISNSHNIRDYFAAQNYKPTAEIEKITKKIKPTAFAKNIFYASNPQVENSDEFNQNCRNREEDSAILGCYKSGRIHVFDVQNSKLKGVKDVTAAHELLHAIWERMNSEEKDKIGKLLEAQYEKSKDPEFEKLMESYDRTEPGEKINELHSLIGTEQIELSKELEDHYAKFFKNRKEIAEIYQGYNNNFKTLKNKTETLTAELQKIKPEIEELTKKYNSDSEELEAEISEFNTNAKNGHYKSQSEFYRDRSKLVAEINKLTESRVNLNSLINSYNSKIKELQESSIEQNELYKSINSNLNSPSL